MSLYEKIIETYPELTIDNFGRNGEIVLRDDSDGLGAYIERLDYSKPIPDGLKLGK